MDFVPREPFAASRIGSIARQHQSQALDLPLSPNQREPNSLQPVPHSNRLRLDFVPRIHGRILNGQAHEIEKLEERHGKTLTAWVRCHYTPALALAIAPSGVHRIF